jgi:two-component sensor histidine kinase
MLLREVHHRVKNNMMVISSLLQLQSKALNEPKAAEVFRECRNRIGTMMIIYDKLYRSPDLTRVNFNEYITDLVISLFDSYNIDPDKIGVELSLSDIPIDIETAIPCGIIINELISNALKYGFPDGGSGTIKVSIRPLGNTAAELLVYNNGLEIPDTVDIHSANTFGLELAKKRRRDGIQYLFQNHAGPLSPGGSMPSGQLRSVRERGIYFPTIAPVNNSA